MGDRANIVVQESEGNRVFLYTHWNGSELPEILRLALGHGQGRWNDPQYLARIIFCEMVGENTQETTGYGISSRVHDNSYPLIVVDCENQEIRLEAERDGSHAPKNTQSQPIADFVALEVADWSVLNKTTETA